MQRLWDRLAIKICVVAVFVVGLTLITILVAYKLPSKNSNRELPWSGLQDRASAIVKLQSEDEVDRKEALIALWYKSYDLQDSEAAALLDFICLATPQSPRERDMAREILKSASGRSEELIIERLRTLLGGGKRLETDEAKCLIQILIGLDPNYTSAIECDMDGVVIKSVNIELLGEIKRSRMHGK